MRHADYLLLRYSPATFAEWDDSTRAYALRHFTLAVRHPNGRQPFELWRRTTPPALVDDSKPAMLWCHSLDD